jgi:hypothetical protein
MTRPVTDDIKETIAKPKVYRVVVETLNKTKTGWTVNSRKIITFPGIEDYIDKYGEFEDQ